MASRLCLAVIGLVGLCAGALSHSYLGLFHDAGLYTLQALAHLHPESLRQDVFLKFGSQDGFTVFGPIYAAVIRMLGVQPAAAVLTLTSQLLLVLAAGVLARTVLPARSAALGLLVLVAVPGDYGAGQIFTCIESFLTPRMAAEALVLFSVGAALSGRRTLAIALTATAALLHPILALAGAAALLHLYVGRTRPCTTAAVLFAGVAIVAVVASVLPLGPWGRFDHEWLAWVQSRSPYLFLSGWRFDDVCRAAIPLTTLAIGSRVLASERARALALIALVPTLVGLALTGIACDLLHVVRVTQLQPWRWQWLATAAAALLVPQIVEGLWTGSSMARRTAALLLIVAWVFAANAYGLAAAAAAVAALALMPRLKAGEARWLLYGAGGLLAIALAWRLASNLEFTDAYFQDPRIPLSWRRAASFVHDGSAPVAAALAAVALTCWRRGTGALIVLAALAACGCALLLPQAWRQWSAHEFPAQRTLQFAEFRRRIPVGAEVFWPSSPLGAWLLLDRPSYLSVIQTSGMVFSQRSAREMARRAYALQAAVNPAAFLGWDAGGVGFSLSPQQLEKACSTGEFPFLVSGIELGRPALAAAPSSAGGASRPMRLYRCP